VHYSALEKEKHVPKIIKPVLSLTEVYHVLCKTDCVCTTGSGCLTG